MRGARPTGQGASTRAKTPRRLRRQLLCLNRRRAPLSSGVDIASACGFAEMSYFARAFKQETGMTPSAYTQARRAKIFAENNEKKKKKNAAV